MLDLLQGRRRVGAVVNLAAPGGAATAVAILTRSTFAGMVGTKNLILKRLKLRNNGAPNTWVHIGTGVGAGVDAIPPLYSVSNTPDDYAEGDLPQVEITAAAIVAWTDAIGVGSVDIQVEAEEV